MSNPHITVLMPVYNAAEFLQDTVNSILQQTRTDWELLAVDDGSTDDSVQILTAVGDPRIRVVSLPQNQGIVAALNRGLDESRGAYIARIDADDIAEPNRLETQCAFLDQNPSVGVCGSDFKRLGDELRSASWVRYFSPEDLAIALLFENPLCHPTVTLRQSAIGDMRYPGNYPHAEEYAFWVSLAAETQLVNLPASLLRYRVHPNQISQIKSEEQSRSMRRVMVEQLRSLGIEPTHRDLQLHATLSHGFFPLPGLDQKLRQWTRHLLSAHQRRPRFSLPHFEAQIRQRREDAVIRCAQKLKTLTPSQRLQWRIRSLGRYLWR